MVIICVSATLGGKAEMLIEKFAPEGAITRLLFADEFVASDVPVSDPIAEALKITVPGFTVLYVHVNDALPLTGIDAMLAGATVPTWVTLPVPDITIACGVTSVAATKPVLVMLSTTVISWFSGTGVTGA